MEREDKRGVYSNSKFSQMKGIKDPGQNGDCENGNEDEVLT